MTVTPRSGRPDMLLRWVTLFALLAPLAPGAPVPPSGEALRADDAAEAPDGQRGFGVQPTTDDLRRWFQAREGPDAEFIAGLRELEPALRERLDALREFSGDLGYQRLLEPERRREFELSELHAAFLEVEAVPEVLLDAGGEQAQALAAMLLDERFRARAHVLRGWQESARELRQGLDLFGATTDRFVVLSDSELGALGPRVDLAASQLRALSNDLAVLVPRELEGAEKRQLIAATRELLSLPQAERRIRLRAAGQAAERMTSMLFSSRLEARPDVARALALREEVLVRTRQVRRRILELLPDTEEGQAASSEVANLRKHERIRAAGAAGLEGLALDPLDEVCAYAAGYAEHFAWGARRSRHLFDRYLVLRGIRAHEHLTLKGRKLTAWEQEALAAVTTKF